MKREGFIERADTMPTWINYQTEYLRSGRNDAKFFGLTKSNRRIYLARTLHKGYYVPGYAVDGVGYFVSKKLQPFQTKNFQVLTGMEVEFSKCHEKGIAAVERDKTRYLIGSFCIEDKRFCGLVLDNIICCINFDGKIYTKEAPDFEFIAKKSHRVRRGGLKMKENSRLNVERLARK
ncbi:Hypothetical predicted protein [Cloeon dipterum]|uniref:Uncharacterized protein n=1 Tax=Cloeon dipterum TaxID=197152 RepID=A0A8S1E1W2_9INSE|nr:Hypothetical predicted protein [Cloeon dipterum]